jgi:hypothetical protein
MPIFRFPEDPSWNADRDSVEFAVEVGEYRGLVIVPRRIVHDLLGSRPTPEQCVEYCFVHRTEFERIAEQKIRARELGEDANVHVSGRDTSRSPAKSGR